MNDQNQEKTTTIHPKSVGQGCAYLMALVIIAVIEFVEAIPYYLRFYAWYMWHFTIWQIIFFVRTSYWRLSTEPEYRKHTLFIFYGFLSILAWLVLLPSSIITGASLAGLSLPSALPTFPWYVIVLANVLPLVLLSLCRKHKFAAVSNRTATYEVGSPKYNAQVVQAIRTLNERLAPHGKRVPERVAIDIIQQIEGNEQ